MRGKTADKGDKLVEKRLIKSLAYYFSEGYTVENAAFKCDIPPQVALELTNKPEFKKTLGEISENALKAWEDSQEEDSIVVHVRQQAKKDGMSFYKQMKSDIEALDPKDRIPLLEKLLRLGGYFDKEEIRETITLAPSAIAALRETKTEMDKLPEDIKNPYDA